MRHARTRACEHTLLITGGTSGICRALAAQLLTRGNTVVITGLRAAEAERMVAAHARLSVP